MENKNLQQALELSVDRVAEIMVQELFENGSVASGALAKSVQDDNGVVKDQKGNLMGELTMLSYGEAVDGGFRFRGTGKLPPDRPGERPIRDWIKRKRINRPAKFKDETSWIWAIRKSIGKKTKGRTLKTRPYPFIDKSFDKAEPFITKILEEAGLKDLTITTKLLFEQSAS